jgi:Cu2+-exporting ATPase
VRLLSSTTLERGAPGRISVDSERSTATGPGQCKHCGLVVPAHRRSSAFCCAGCEAVFALLREEGLGRFYELGGDQLGSVGAVPRQVALDWLPEVEAESRDGQGRVQLVVDVQGIRCAACVWLLQELFKRTPGAVAIRLDASLGRAVLLYDAELGAGRAFLERAAALGYPMARATRKAALHDGLLLRLGVTAAIAMNAMILAASQYFGLAGEDAWLDLLFNRVQLGLATASVLVGGPVFFRAAWSGLQAGMLHMDLPISLGLVLAYAGSVYGHIAGGESYFDTVAIFVALMVGGRFLQQRSLQRSRDQILADDGAEHLRARRLRDGAVEVVPIVEVVAGDELLLAPGDLLPVRARLLEQVSLSLDWINGESEPRAFAADEIVPAGAVLAGQKAARLVAVGSYAESGLAELLQQPPGEDPDRKAVGRIYFWDLLARRYSVAVLVAATVAGLVWWGIDASRALSVTVAVLVVTCPCALGIALPLSVHLAHARLRRGGVFVRSQTLLDKLLRVRKVLFDKTGTLTLGGLRATADRSLSADCRDVLVTMAASSNHPASQAVLEWLGDGQGFCSGLVVEEVPGGGLRTVRDGVEFRLGSARFCGLKASAMRECLFVADGRELARFQLEEDYRSGADEEVRLLQARGLEVLLLSGDRSDRVAEAARLLGVPTGKAHGDLSPDDKREFVAAIDEADTLMVGDGINDAPAFGAAFCAATPAMDRPVLPGRADFFYRGANAGAVAHAFEVVERHRAVVRCNLGLAVAYNLVALTLCLLGQMTPLVCAVSMPLSSLALVVHTTWRLGRGARRSAGPQGVGA